MPDYSSPYDIPPVMGGLAQDLSSWASKTLSQSAAQVFTTTSGQEAVAAVTAAAVHSAAETAKKEVAKLLLPAFLAGIAVAIIVQRTKR